MLFVTFVLATGAAGLVLWWGHLPGPWRRTLALLTSAAGLLFLVMAVRTEGVREASTTAMFLIGPSYVTEQASASASLPYYVMTAVCLLLGTLGLAAGDDTAARLSRHWMATAIGLSLALTALRFCLEKVAAPHALAYGVGIIWLPPIVGAFFAYNLRREGKGLVSLVLALLAYSFAARALVAAVVIAASHFHWGSHYDITPLVAVRNPFTHRAYHYEPGSLDQLMDLGILPQILFWPTFTLVLGFLGGGVAWLATSPASPGEPLGGGVPMVAREDP